MIKLSIIIPYYNTYEYTIKLLRELTIQRIGHENEVEVILVDDGCEETRFDIFTAFNIIHLPIHKGASHAWNVGITKAQGKFIAFIDSDDMILMNYVEELIKAVDEDLADEIFFPWIDVNKGKLMKFWNSRAIWKAIYRREIVPWFDESWQFMTDHPFQRRLRATPHTKAALDTPLYCYRSVREGSLCWRRRHGEFAGIRQVIDDN